MIENTQHEDTEAKKLQEEIDWKNKVIQKRQNDFIRYYGNGQKKARRKLIKLACKASIKRVKRYLGTKLTSEQMHKVVTYKKENMKICGGN